MGRGRAYGANLHPVVDGIIGGWEFVPIYLYSSGPPLTFSVPGNTLGNGWGTRPNLVGDPNLSNPSTNLWFNPAAFAAPGAYLFGTSGIGIMTGPSSQIANLSLNKKFALGEKRYVQFRWEVFNALNHANYDSSSSSLNTTIGQSTTGQIYATV